MNTSSGFAMFKYIVLLLLTTAVAACSFKKDPDSGKPKIVVMQAPEVPAKAKTAEEIISGADEDLAIQELVQAKDLKGTPGSSLLDLAIHYEKIKIINHLIVSGVSPFDINDESYKKLSYSEVLGKLITSAQDDNIVDIIRTYPRALAFPSGEQAFVPSLPLFQKRIEEADLKANGCEHFASFLMDLRYYQEPSYFPGAYYEAFEGVSPEVVFKDLISNSYCSKFVQKFSTTAVSKWLGNEFLFQFQSNFKSIDLMTLLVSLGKSDTVDVSVQRFSDSSLKVDFSSSQFRLDPLSLVVLKKDCFKSTKDFEIWIDFVRGLKAHQDTPYRYLFEGDMKNPDEECSKVLPYCLTNEGNMEALYVNYGAAFPKALSKNDFSFYFLYHLYREKEAKYTSSVRPSINQIHSRNAKKLNEQLCSTLQDVRGER